MLALFIVLFILLVGFVWGLIAPRHLTRTVCITRPVTRRHISFMFGPLIVVLCVLAALTAPSPASKTQHMALSVVPVHTQTSPASNAVTARRMTETKSVVFATVTQQDASLVKGQTRVTQTGVNGVETLLYRVVYTNGVQTSKTLQSDMVTTPSITQIVAIGTYVPPVTPSVVLTPAPSITCTNGTYVNTSGNTVCSPETASGAPSGATAQCRDGTYSFSQHRSGTCSGHAGVAMWL